jgi:hypothetical protein
MTSKALAEQLNSGLSNGQAREKLFVHEDEEGLNLSLYLDQQVFNLMERRNLLDQLDDGDIQDFCLALEGISHFIYLVWNASHGRQVTLMEMELQAEIDKFIILAGLLRQPQGPARKRLLRLLFYSNTYHADLSREESRRYRDASSFAGKYCQRLEEYYFGRGDRQGLLAELRRFYRLTRRDKLQRILRPH